jgi:poly(A) polymerase
VSRPLAIDAAGRLTHRAILDDGRVAAVLGLLDRDGEEARVVGGAVRNALLGLPPGDIDITTTALPAVVTERAKAARLRVIPTGIEHGTVTVVVRGLPLEVTTLREDVATDGRHAVVRFGRDFAEDARRRDFTVNALSVDRAGRVHDSTTGVADLAAGRVRFIGDAATRIREDYLRVLRFFRFSATYATGALDPEGLAACAAEAAGLARLSRERVRAELFKLLVATRAVVAVAGMAATNVLAATVGVPNRPDRQARLAAVEAAGDWPADAIRRLAALSLAGADDVGRLREMLRLSNDERDRLGRMSEALALWQADGAAPPRALAILESLYRLGRQATLDAILLAHADSGAPADDPTWLDAGRRAMAVTVPSLPLSGADLLAHGLKAGPEVGAVLKDVQARWIRAGFPQEPMRLQQLLEDAVAAVNRLN